MSTNKTPLDQALEIAEAIGIALSQNTPYALDDPFQGYDRAQIIKLIGRARYDEAFKAQREERRQRAAEEIEKGNVIGQAVIGTRGKVKGRVGVVVKELPSKVYEGMSWVCCDLNTAEEYFVNPKSAKPYALTESQLQAYEKLRERSNNVANAICHRGQQVVCVYEKSPYHGMEGVIIGLGTTSAPVRQIPVYFTGEPKEVYLPAHFLAPNPKA